MNPVRHALWWFGFLAILSTPLAAAEYAGQVVSAGET